MNKRQNSGGKTERLPSERCQLAPSSDFAMILVDMREDAEHAKKRDRLGTLAWCRQAKRVEMLANQHHLKGQRLYAVCAENGLDDPTTVKRLRKLAPMADDLIVMCEEMASADPGFTWPGLQTALKMVFPPPPREPQEPKPNEPPDHIYSVDDLRAWFPDLVMAIEEAAADQLADAKDEIERLEQKITQLKAQVAELRKKRNAVKQSDICYTPRSLAKQIIDHFQPTGLVLDPARGDGSFFDQFPKDCESVWCEILEVHGREGRDFLGWTVSVDWIVTNGPWSGQAAGPFQKHCLEVADNVVLLLPGQMGVSTYSRIKYAKRRAMPSRRL